MSLWVGFLAFLRFFIPSFLSFQNKLNEKAFKSEGDLKQDVNETKNVSRDRKNVRSASRYLLGDSAYDTLHDSVSHDSSIEQGIISDNSDQIFVSKSSYDNKRSNCTLRASQKACFSPVNTQYGSPSHVTRSSPMERRNGVYSPENEQQHFADNRKTPHGVYYDDAYVDKNLPDQNNCFGSSCSKLRQRKHKEPDVYNGEKVEWPDYLCHFEQVSTWNEWDDSEKANQLAMSLRGRAQRVLSELTFHELQSYSELKYALTQRFSPPERETAYKCDFRNRRRQPGESASDYGYVLKRLASRAFPSFPSDMRETLTVEQFVTGLRSQELKRYVQFSHPKTLDRAISLAIEFESFEGTQDTIRKPQDCEKSSIRAVLPPQKDSSENHLNLQNLEKSIEQIVQKTLATFVDKKRGNGPEKRATNSDTSRDIKCFNCKQSGHISRNCPAKSPRGNTCSYEHRTENDPNHLNESGLRSRPTAQPDKKSQA